MADWSASVSLARGGSLWIRSRFIWRRVVPYATYAVPALQAGRLRSSPYLRPIYCISGFGVLTITLWFWNFSAMFTGLIS